MSEQWEPIPGYEGIYEVSSSGRVRRLGGVRIDGRNELKERIRKPTLENGYLYVRLSHGTKRKHAVHRLVLEAFVGPCPQGMVACHVNGDRKDNRISNLYWGTPQQNEADKVAHGTRPLGERHHNSKLTQEDVKEIRRRRRDGEKLASLAARFGVTEANISCIALGKGWK